MSSSLKMTILTLVIMLGVTLVSLLTTDMETKVEPTEPHIIEANAPKADTK